MCEVGAVSVDAPGWHRRGASGVAFPFAGITCSDTTSSSFCLSKGHFKEYFFKSLLCLHKGKISVCYFSGWRAASTTYSSSLKSTFPHTSWTH